MAAARLKREEIMFGADLDQLINEAGKEGKSCRSERLSGFISGEPELEEPVTWVLQGLGPRFETEPGTTERASSITEPADPNRK